LEPELLAFQPLGIKISLEQLAPLGRLLKNAGVTSHQLNALLIYSSSQI
jgi:hypothetical protein